MSDIGVGFGGGSQLSAPLVRGLGLGGSARRAQLGPRDYAVLATVQEACLTDTREIVLSEADLFAFGQGASDFPSSFGIMGTFSAESPHAVEEGRFTFDLQALFGPPAAGSSWAGSAAATRN